MPFMRLCVVLLIAREIVGITETPTDEFLLRFDTKVLTDVKNDLAKVNITFVKQILPGTYMFKDDGETSGIPAVLLQNPKLKNQVTQFERVIEYVVDLWTKMPGSQGSLPSIDTHTTPNVSTYFDMGVEGAWRMNYTGRGVVIGVTDIGVDTNVEDLKPSIDVSSSYNAVEDKKSNDVTPEQFDDYEKTLFITDHGNRCVGMIAASKNNKCGDGVAYDAKIAVLRIFRASFDPYDLDHPHGRIHFRNARMAEGIRHGMPTVDVYSNSWGTVHDFEEKNDLVINAIEDTVKQGRGGKGSVHVFPVGSLADPYANDVTTVAVNSVAYGGRLPTFARACACTLTSAYGEGCDNITSCDTSRMLTTSRVRGCTLEFEGTSASTAIVSGIIALALQANPTLGWREVQHIVVEASGCHSNMTEFNNFRKNGAGKLFHPVLGFGLLNATKLVTLARTRQPLSQQLVMTATSSSLKKNGKTTDVKFTLTCTGDLCINSTEHVVLTLSFTAPKVYHSHVTLVSPAGTESLLMDKHLTNGSGPTTHDNVEFLSVNFWGEAVDGTWTLHVKSRLESAETITITHAELKACGTGIGENRPQATDTVSEDQTTPKTVAVPDEGSPTVVIYFVGLVTLSGILFAIGFREMIKERRQNSYSAIQL